MDKVLNDKAGREKGCCIVAYGLAYLAAIPIGFLIEKIWGPERIIRVILGLEKKREEMGGWEK